MVSSYIHLFHRLTSNQSNFMPYQQETKHPHLHGIYTNFKILKRIMAGRLSRERPNRREKRPQDGKTNPME